jgi:hypothetical protein
VSQGWTEPRTRPGLAWSRGWWRADGRVIVLAALAVYLGAVVILRVLWGFDPWARLAVWPGTAVFLDAANITSAVECARAGYDPLVENPCDPHGRPMNYPRAWLALGWFGIDASWTFALGLAMAGALIAGLLLLFGRLSCRQGWIVAAAVCSPSVMLGVERGQSDLLIFALLASAVALWRRGAPAAPVLGPLLVFAATVLKIFPAVALAAYWLARDAKAAWVALACALGTVLYFVLTLPDLAAISEALPQHRMHSYGAKILVGSALSRVLPAYAHPHVVQLIAMLAVGVLALSAWWAASRFLPSQHLGGGDRTDWRLHAFHLGALVYLATFTLINSWDYRLVFLLLTLPQLLEWSDDASPLRGWGRTGTALVLAVLYLGPLLAERSLADVFANWALAWVLFAFLAPSVRETVVVRGSRAVPAG